MKQTLCDCCGNPIPSEFKTINTKSTYKTNISITFVTCLSGGPLDIRMDVCFPCQVKLLTE